MNEDSVFSTTPAPAGSSGPGAGTASSDELTRQLLIKVDPRLSRFDPLRRIIFFDDFDDGLRGWTELMPNYEGSLDHLMNPNSYMLLDKRPPMLSSSSTWDTGTAGSLDGTYALKVTTRPQKGHLPKALKRITWFRRGLLQCEAIFTFKAEASELTLGDVDFRAFGLSYDLQDDGYRYWPAVRYLNAEDGVLQQKWQAHTGGVRHPHHDGWSDIPGGHQPLCYNEIATKQNWHYLRWLIDLRSREYVDLQCNERVWDLRGLRHEPTPVKPNLWYLLNVGFWAEADKDKRAFLLLDSVVLSSEV